MLEIIDLTVSPSLSEPIEIFSEGEIPTISLNYDNHSSQKRKRERPRKRNKSKGSPCDGVDSSRNQSLERRNGTNTRMQTVSGRRSASPKRCSPAQGVSDQELFFFDAAPAPVEGSMHSLKLRPESSQSTETRLLLPSHVSVLSAGKDGFLPVEIIAPLPIDSEEEDYIEYLDYEDRKAPGLVRYFEVEAEEATQVKLTRHVCKNCGAEGEHKTYECPVQVCLTCGARDEHSTRSCPISKICFACGMKGHINKTCPHRFSLPRLGADKDNDCERCGSQIHKMNECPTLWRIYQYVDDEDRVVIMQTRKEKKKLLLGNGGEGYIASEEWCYNCGNPGHLGDECDEIAHAFDVPAEPSAFSSHNIMSGPFYDPESEPICVRRGPRELQNGKDNPTLHDDWGMNAPLNVGKQGKNKEKEKMAQRFRDQEEDDTGDWFNNPRNTRNRGNDRTANGQKTIKFGSSMKDIGRNSVPPHSASTRKNGHLSLLDRLGDNPHHDHRRRTGDYYSPSKESESYRIRGASKNSRDLDGEYSRSHSGREREWRRRREPRDDWGHRQGNEPKYKGGYSR